MGIEGNLQTAHVNTVALAQANSWQPEQHLMFAHYPQFHGRQKRGPIWGSE